MSVFRFVLVGMAALLFFGCSSSYLVDKPCVLDPCHKDNAREMSTAALIKAFQSKRWSIRGADPAAGLVRAEACRGTYCISVDAHVDKAGRIEIARTPGQYISGKGGRLLQHWMGHLSRAYDRYRCSAPDILRAEMKKQVFPPFKKFKVPVGS